MAYNVNSYYSSGDDMQTTTDFLDMLKAKRGLRSDYALCKLLGWTSSRIANYRKKRSFLEDDTAVLVAEMLEIDPAIVLAAVHFERAKKEAEKAVWMGMWERLGGLAASVLAALGVVLMGYASVLPNDAQAGDLSATVNIHYTKCLDTYLIKKQVFSPIARIRAFLLSFRPRRHNPMSCGLFMAS